MSRNKGLIKARSKSERSLRVPPNLIANADDNDVTEQRILMKTKSKSARALRVELMEHDTEGSRSSSEKNKKTAWFWQRVKKQQKGRTGSSDNRTALMKRQKSKSERVFKAQNDNNDHKESDGRPTLRKQFKSESFIGQLKNEEEMEQSEANENFAFAAIRGFLNRLEQDGRDYEKQKEHAKRRQQKKSHSSSQSHQSQPSQAETGDLSFFERLEEVGKEHHRKQEKGRQKARAAEENRNSHKSTVKGSTRRGSSGNKISFFFNSLEEAGRTIEEKSKLDRQNLAHRFTDDVSSTKKKGNKKTTKVTASMMDEHLRVKNADGPNFYSRTTFSRKREEKNHPIKV